MILSELLKEVGGLHHFMNWKRAMLTGSVLTERLERN